MLYLYQTFESKTIERATDDIFLMGYEVIMWYETIKI